MKKMFLCSSFKDSYSLLSDFTGESLKGKRVTFFPTASAVEEVTHYVEAAKEAFHQLGMQLEIVQIAEQSTEEIIKMIKQNDVVYVSGGNTFYLLQELRKHGLDDVLKEEINKGKLYIGESAGSIIMAPSIEYISVMDDRQKAPELSSYQGFNEISYCPVPHMYNTYLGEAAQQIMEQYEQTLDLCPLTDEQALLITGEQAEVKSDKSS
ncbi:Type 1 glutamine amidotransferase-like domain-containing protein [Bacillus pumilus]|uniref:Type 1 glutamine amidotransferase-like domain-containing protein n=1 Tax=Bacillus TaxID=1386 RepID=UPI00017A6469|nr:Type 1 glutamine amidotransferase-like domain-containing protein [Bacillus pumilus]EDW20021.1 peptidase E, putative [Bacillus pumilus ATCC 7061]MBR0591658.1 type 1 glutamine amidotransferase-like domain-containing protein [Bacillus pumilus sxm20-2]KMY21518.1 peptidase S51 [Bacillus pumilus]MCP1529067.1 dipeptidase E [Bacillus pumilus]MDF9784451.1 dipeptidase E [Bacillus pumilus]